MALAVMRVAKMKTMGAIGAACSHNDRARETPNADPVRLKENFRLDLYQDRGTFEAVTHLLPEKVRKNGVLAVEVVMSASPEFFKGGFGTNNSKTNTWAQECKGWLSKEFGGEKNIANFVVHMDEQTPHIHAIVVPLKDGKLNCRAYLGGTRDRLSKLQDRFVEHLKNEFSDIKRGEKGSKAKHVEVAEYYAQMKKDMDAYPELKRELESMRKDAAAAEVKRAPPLNKIPILGYDSKQVEAYQEWVTKNVIPYGRRAVDLEKDVETIKEDLTKETKKASEEALKRAKVERELSTVQKALIEARRPAELWKKTFGTELGPVIEKQCAKEIEKRRIEAPQKSPPQKGMEI